MMEIKRGIPASSGISIARVLNLGKEFLPVSKRILQEEELEQELNKFDTAIEKTKKDISEIKEKVAGEIDQVYQNIFDVYTLILDDPLFVHDVRKKIKNDRLNSEYALQTTVDSLSENFSSIKDRYLRDKIMDIKDLSRKLMKNLLEHEKTDYSNLKEDVIIIAHNLSPADTALMKRSRIVGFATDIGSTTSHTAIMARALEIPAVVGLKDITEKVSSGDEIILDGVRGQVIIGPLEKTKEQYLRFKKEYQLYEDSLRELSKKPAVTRDGFAVTMNANIEMTDEIDSVLSHGADGIGLYRTEFLFMNKNYIPGEEEQYEVYRAVVEKMGDRPVTIRTIDLGGDKFVSKIGIPEEMNPFMGWRAIRFCLERVDIFKTQLRAILRAAVFGKVHIMIPMVSSLWEIAKTKEILEETKQELAAEGKEFSRDIKLGVMVEVPSLAIIADLVATQVDFMSIGTNDLIQYTLAVDRVNEKIAHLYEPLHPSILRLIKTVITAGEKNSIPVSMCGEMAANPLYTIILLGMGLKIFSMSAITIPEIKKRICDINFKDAKKIADKVLKLSNVAEIKKTLAEEKRTI